MAQEEGILSVRGLIDSDIGPLRRFTGVLDSAPEETKTYGEGDQKRISVQVSLNFKDIEPIESIEPYHFPTYTILLTKSNRKKSKYGVFGTSLVAIIDQELTEAQLDSSSLEFIKPQDRPDLNDCFGKRFGMVMADGEDGRPAMHLLFDGRAKDETHPRGQDTPQAVWEVYMVEGYGVVGEAGVSPINKAMELLDGKTLAEFNKLTLDDDIIRSDPGLLTSIGLPPSAAGSFANQMLVGKQFTKDKAGVFHRIVS